MTLLFPLSLEQMRNYVRQQSRWLQAMPPTESFQSSIQRSLAKWPFLLGIYVVEFLKLLIALFMSRMMPFHRFPEYAATGARSCIPLAGTDPMNFYPGIPRVAVERAPDKESVKCIHLEQLICHGLRQVAQLLRAFPSSLNRLSHKTRVEVAQAPSTFQEAASQSVRTALEKTVCTPVYLINDTTRGHFCGASTLVEHLNEVNASHLRHVYS